MEEESFELLSSMSPNVKHCQKHFRKGTTVLALRRSLQRSSMYDKSIHTLDNDKIRTTETSSTTTTESNNSRSSILQKKLLNITTIIIHDSDSDCDDIKLISPQSNLSEMAKQSENVCGVKTVPYSLLQQDKFYDIKQWIDSVHQSKIDDNTVYSDLSTIYDEANSNFVTERTGRAVNSTAVIGSVNLHFDELFKRKIDCTPEKPKEVCKNEEDSIDESFNQQKDIKNTSNEQDVIDESYVNKSTNLTKGSQSSSRKISDQLVKKYLNNDSDENLCRHITSRGKKEVSKSSDDSFSVLNESLSSRLQKNKSQVSLTPEKSNISNKTPNKEEYLMNKTENNIDNNGSESDNENDLASMLDDLYGNKWREKEDHVLPKTEPRKRMPTPNNIRNVNTERKPKFSVLYKNPYLECERSKSNDLLQSLQRSRLKHYEESPILKRLNVFCDSDTDSKDSNSKIYPRTKLNFIDSDNENDDCNIIKEIQNGGGDDRTSKYFRKNVEKEKATHDTKGKRDDSDKENSDEFSFLGQTLEERIRKKINGNGIKSRGEAGKKKTVKSLGGKTTNKSDTGSNKTDKKTINNTKKTEKKTDDRKSSISNSSTSSDDVWEKEISKIVHENKPVNGKYSFLASLSANVPIYQCDMSARIYRNNFRSYKDQLLTKLFNLFNEKVFGNALPQDTLLEWNDRMRGTAGFCYCKKITRRTGAVERTARIVLSTKVIDAAYRLRDTLIHEMCHAATWIVNCVSDGHGPYWKSWAYKAMKTFPELPPIKRCHDYVINTKYTYKCTGCGYSIGRHTKSLDIERKRCGHCYGKFEVLLNKVGKKGETKSVPATPKKEATGFALFVKENYGVYKQGNLKHGDVMKLLGQKFQEMKLKSN